MLKVLDDMSRNLKRDRQTYDIIARFMRSMNQLIDKAVRGDTHALDEARRQVRWMESNYHLVPYVLRQKIPRIYGADVPKTTEDWLIRFQPWRHWYRIQDIVAAVAITWAVTETLTLSVLFALRII